MAQPRLAIQKIKDVLREHLVVGLVTCRRLAIAMDEENRQWRTVYAAPRWPISSTGQAAPNPMTELSRRLYPVGLATASRLSARPLPDWVKVREELARRDHQTTLACTAHLRLLHAFLEVDRMLSCLTPIKKCSPLKLRD